MAQRTKFISMCHSLYDHLHGKEQISKIFNPISEEQLSAIIRIYDQQLFKRMCLIEEYIETIPEIENKIKLKNGGELHAANFYINAIQHYNTKDY